MAMDHELKRAKWFLCGIVLFIVSCFFAYEEWAYLTNGREAIATITAVTPVTTQRRSGTRKSLRVDFAFVEPNGTQRTGSESESTDWTPPATGQVKVRYTPGTYGRVRFAGRVNWAGVGLFIGSLCILGFFGGRLWLEAREATRPRKKKRVHHE